MGLRSHVAYLIKEQRTAVTLLELADALTLGTCEGAFLVAKELALQQVFRDGCAIDGEERLAAAFAVAVNGARNQLLASAAFAGDQHRGITGGQLAYGLEHLLHRGALADDA